MTHVAERIDAPTKPEAKWDNDTYRMKQAGMCPREQDSDPRQGLVLFWLTDWDLGRSFRPISAHMKPLLCNTHFRSQKRCLQKASQKCIYSVVNPFV